MPIALEELLVVVVDLVERIHKRKVERKRRREADIEK